MEKSFLCIVTSWVEFELFTPSREDHHWRWAGSDAGEREPIHLHVWRECPVGCSRAFVCTRAFPELPKRSPVHQQFSSAFVFQRLYQIPKSLDKLSMKLSHVTKTSWSWRPVSESCTRCSWTWPCSWRRRYSHRHLSFSGTGNGRFWRLLVGSGIPGKPLVWLQSQNSKVNCNVLVT